MAKSLARVVVGALALAGALGLHGCGLIQDYRVCDDVPARRQAKLPPRLSQTGLWVDPASETLAPGVLAYTPRFALWSDGAEKRRWMWLPPGTRIDTSDLAAWQFPEGTRFWKEFVRDGVRVETRLLQKVGPAPGDWAAVAYVWRGDDAYAAPDGAVDALGTSHNVPAASECFGCHGGTASRVLGFSAVQLAHAPAGSPDLDALGAQSLLTAPPATPVEVPGDEAAQQALGYLHANCSHCHNQTRPAHDGARCFDPQRDFDFMLRPSELSSVEQTATYRTALGRVIRPGAPDQSEVIARVSSRDAFPPGMPPLGTEQVDPHGVAVLRAWIGGLR